MAKRNTLVDTVGAYLHDAHPVHQHPGQFAVGLGMLFRSLDQKSVKGHAFPLFSRHDRFSPQSVAVTVYLLLSRAIWMAA